MIFLFSIYCWHIPFHPHCSHLNPHNILLYYISVDSQWCLHLHPVKSDKVLSNSHQNPNSLPFNGYEIPENHKKNTIKSTKTTIQPPSATIKIHIFGSSFLSFQGVVTLARPGRSTDVLSALRVPVMEPGGIWGVWHRKINLTNYYWCLVGNGWEWGNGWLLIAIVDHSLIPY